jgi:hypothetical protein
MRIAPLVALGLLLTACGPTLTLGPNGWHEDSAAYTVAPLDDGKLFTPAWYLADYATKDQGYRHDDASESDFTLKRREDDGVMVAYSNPLTGETREKAPEVLADRWVDRVVANPKSDDPWLDAYHEVVPTLEMTSEAHVGLYSASSHTVLGHDVQVLKREAFQVPGGTGAELVAKIGPKGANADRAVYVAVAKADKGDRYVILAYGNTVAQFEKGFDDARSFAHRVKF